MRESFKLLPLMLGISYLVMQREYPERWQAILYGLLGGVGLFLFYTEWLVLANRLFPEKQPQPTEAADKADPASTNEQGAVSTFDTGGIISSREDSTGNRLFYYGQEEYPSRIAVGNACDRDFLKNFAVNYRVYSLQLPSGFMVPRVPNRQWTWDGECFLLVAEISLEAEMQLIYEQEQRGKPSSQATGETPRQLGCDGKS